MPTSKHTYTVVYENDAETGAVTASVPALDLSTYGTDLAAARAHLLEALALHLEGLIEENLPIPPDVIHTERVTVAKVG